MLQKVQGIVVSTMPYSDTSIITKIFTDQFGLLAFIIKGARSKKSANKAVLFQPLSILELDIYYHEKKQLHTIRESKLLYNTSAIQGDMLKTSVLLFVAEVLHKLMKDGYQNPSLFELLKHRIQSLLDSPFDADFHLHLLIDMTMELGFYPLDNYSRLEPVFSIQDGKFVTASSAHIGAYYLSETDSHHLYQFLSGAQLNLNTLQRRSLLAELVKYYQYHNPGMTAIKSAAVLQEIF